MPIQGIEQANVISISDDVRLRRFDDRFDFALAWYQDVELVYLVDGKRSSYDPEQLARMYHYLDHMGELYFIEVRAGEGWKPVGDVTFCQEDIPIVIGDGAYRGRGLGRKVITALIERGRTLGYDRLYVREIYHHNTASRRCFESCGFRVWEESAQGARYVLDL